MIGVWNAAADDDDGVRTNKRILGSKWSPMGRYNYQFSNKVGFEN